MPKPKSTPPSKPPTVLVKPKENFKNELLERIELGEGLYGREITDIQQLTQLNSDAAGWNDYNEELIKRAFNNHDSEYFYEYYRLNQLTGFYDIARGINTETAHYKISRSKEKIENCLVWLKQLVQKLPLIDEDRSIEKFQTKERIFFNSGFIVHGHNEARKFEVARFIENDLRRKVIILHEQANKGRTIIEKFEGHSSVEFAVAIWTADDQGKANSEEHLKGRARQNVVFETGYFIGKIGRENVIVLYENGVELPSDYSGVIFISFDGNWKDDLRKEIDAIYHLA